MSDINETTVIADEPAGRNPAVLALAVLGALLAGALVWFFVAAPLLQGDDVDASAAGPVAAVADADATAEPPADTSVDAVEAVEAVDEAALPIVTYEVVLSRDPFEPVREVTATDDVTETVTTPGSPTATPVTDGTTDPGTTDPGTTDPGTTDPGTTDPVEPAPSTDGCTSDGDVVCDGASVSVIEVTDGADGRTVIVQVGTSVYEAAEGDTFAGRFRVLSISDTCADFLFGDDRFSLCEGDRVLK